MQQLPGLLLHFNSLSPSLRVFSHRRSLAPLLLLSHSFSLCSHTTHSACWLRKVKHRAGRQNAAQTVRRRQAKDECDLPSQENRCSVFIRTQSGETRGKIQLTASICLLLNYFTSVVLRCLLNLYPMLLFLQSPGSSVCWRVPLFVLLFLHCFSTAFYPGCCATILLSAPSRLLPACLWRPYQSSQCR